MLPLRCTDVKSSDRIISAYFGLAHFSSPNRPAAPRMPTACGQRGFCLPVVPHGAVCLLRSRITCRKTRRGPSSQPSIASCRSYDEFRWRWCFGWHPDAPQWYTQVKVFREPSPIKRPFPVLERRISYIEERSHGYSSSAVRCWLPGAL